MNCTQPYPYFKHFIPPAEDSFIGLRSLVFLSHNILTLGIYSTSNTLMNEKKIRELECEQLDLMHQISVLDHSWEGLEKDFSELVNKAHRIKIKQQTDFNLISDELKNLSLKKGELKEQSIINKNFAKFSTINEIALSVVRFFGLWFANVVTLGTYGIFSYLSLKNRVSFLEAQNHFIQNEFLNRKKNRDQNINALEGFIKDYIDIKSECKTLNEDIQAIRHTEPAVAYSKAKMATMEAAQAKKDLEQINAKFTTLKTEKASVDTLKNHLENEIKNKDFAINTHKARILKVEDENQILKKAKDLLEKQDAKAKLDMAEKQKELVAYHEKVKKVNQLENENAKLLAVQKGQPEIAKLAAELGPISSRYKQRKEDGETSGALDIYIKKEMTAYEKKEIEAKKDKLSDFELISFEDYNVSYGDKLSATDIVIASFKNASRALFEDNDLVKLNKSNLTLKTSGISAIYRVMAYDIVRGGKIISNGCPALGYHLAINDKVKMHPSYSEKVMKYKSIGDTFQPMVEFRYTSRDDFTPDEDNLQIEEGVDPVAIKWILNQLTLEEINEVLLIHLAGHVIENHHPRYIEMRKFMKNETNPRVKLVETASILIQNLARAIQKKFERTALESLLQETFNDDEIEPFKKIEAFDVKEPVELEEEKKFVDWKLDLDVLEDKRSGTSYQKEFAELIEEMQRKTKKISFYIGEDFLAAPKVPGTKYAKLEWPQLQEQYFHCHEMIGNEVKSYGDGYGRLEKGERCLFSNLLAVLVTKKSDLTTNNVNKLRNAMASYLAKIEGAASSWKWHHERRKAAQFLSEGAKQIKEMADLYETFKLSILNTHGCTVENYINWLRKDPISKLKIDLDSLTPLEIQLAAYTIGVRIALLPVNTHGGACKVDKLGRIVPQADFYGPHTEEMLMMGVWDPLDGKAGSYYGLFPKLNLENELLKYDKDARKAAEDLIQYWNTIQLKPGK